MNAPTRILAAAALMVALAGCGVYGYDEPFRYFQRLDTITTSAGDSQAANRVTHMQTPWPPYVFDQHIAADGQRTAIAVRTYRSGADRKNTQSSGAGAAAGAGSSAR